MKKAYKIIGGIVLFLLVAIFAIFFYIKRTAPPGEEWIAYGNETLIEIIDHQIHDLDMERILEEKEELVLEKSVEELQQAVRQGELTYEELTAIYLHRIKTLDQREHGYNSVMAIAPDAVEQAGKRDEERLRADEGTVFPPLFGIPVMLKDNIHTADMPSSAGTVAFEEFIPEKDAELVQKLREQGAVVIGKNNLSEFAYYVSSTMPSGYSGKKGQTVNPFGPLKISPSGSSSGSAVAVTANLIPISIGTETAGSIMGPASANSVVGFKPTRDTVSGEGIFPLVKKVDTAGPIAKTVRDAALAYEAISGETVSLSLQRTSLEGMTIGLVSYDYEDASMIRKIKNGLEKSGARVKEITLDGSGVQVQNIIAQTFKQDFKDFTGLHGYPITELQNLIEFNRADPDRRARYGQDLLEEANEVAQPDVTQIEASIRQAQAQLDTLFEENGLDAIAFLKTSASTEMAASGYPELCVPFGEDEKGEPMGVTFGGLYREDEKLLNIGYAFEQFEKGRLKLDED